MRVYDQRIWECEEYYFSCKASLQTTLALGILCVLIRPAHDGVVVMGSLRKGGGVIGGIGITAMHLGNDLAVAGVQLP